MKILRTSLVLIILILSSSLIFGENLITNSSFEETINNEPTFWAKDAWQLKGGETQFYIDQGISYSGKNSVVIHNIRTNDARLVQGLSVKPMTYYVLTCMVRAENCGGGKGANIGVIDPQIFQSSQDLKDTGGQWKKLTFTVFTAPKQSIMSVCVRLGQFGKDNTGKAWFDDFTVEETTDPQFINSAVQLPQTVTTQAEGDRPQSSSNSWGTGILVILGIIVVLGFLGALAYFFFISRRSNKHLPLAIQNESQLTKFTKWDLILCGALTLVYAIVALMHLGSLSAPQTYWKPSRTSEGFVVDFGEPQDIGRIYYWEGLPQGHMTHGVYLTFVSNDGENWETLTKLDPGTQSYWYYKSVNKRARYVRVLAETAGALLNEVVFVDPSYSKVIPIVDIKAAKGSTQLEEYKKCIDEQDTVAFRPDFFNGMTPGYDEQYHGRTAFENIIFQPPFENTHPPLGKLFIALGILIFGMNPFGWRIAGAFFGILMIPLMYAFGKELFKRTELAFASALLIALDFMHFTQSRVSVIDVYGVFFIILMYYFMARYYKLSFFKTDFRKTLWPLLFSGVACGFGAASKWIAIYAFIGLALLFFVSLGKKIVEYFNKKRALKAKMIDDKEERHHTEQIIKAYPKFIGRTILFCLLAFILIPTAIYVASYMPILMAPDINFDWNYIIENNTGMFDYHSHVTESHPSATSWNEWPLIIRPFLYYTGQNLPSGMRQIMAAFGNPAIWWGGSILTLIVIVLSIIGLFNRVSSTSRQTGKLLPLDLLTQKKGRSDARFIILIALASQYLPWIISARTLTFIYHFFATVPFIILASVYFFQYLEDKLILLVPQNPESEPKKWTKIIVQVPLWLFVLWALINFILFFPIISATIVKSSYIQSLDWLRTWPW